VLFVVWHSQKNVRLTCLIADVPAICAGDLNANSPLANLTILADVDDCPTVLNSKHVLAFGNVTEQAVIWLTTDGAAV